MGMTIIEKILARNSGAAKVSPGDLVVVDVDTAVLLESAFFAGGYNILKVTNPEKVAVVFDHFTPAPDVKSASAHVRGREFVKRFGIKRFHDVGRDQGISHIIVAEHGYALPGTVLVLSDSHTCASGAFNCAARGIGRMDTMWAVTTGKAWFEVGETIRYDLEGKLAPGVTAKDVFLHIAQTYGDHTGQNIEFGGSAMPDLSLNARRTITTMGAELGAEFATFEPDDILLDYVRSRTPAPFEEQYPDPDATYKDRLTLALDRMEPMVAMPDSVIKNAVPVGEAAGQRIDQAFIGSCANGTLDDFALAARVLEGNRVSPDVRLIITPGSQEIYRDALKAGYVSTLMEAGAVVTNATCGACGGGGGHMGILGPNEVCITASTRNFKGRMGDPSARIFMASPATVAASAITGTITHPGNFLQEGVL